MDEDLTLPYALVIVELSKGPGGLVALNQLHDDHPELMPVVQDAIERVELWHAVNGRFVSPPDAGPG